jgi:hypothetical protein
VIVCKVKKKIVCRPVHKVKPFIRCRKSQPKRKKKTGLSFLRRLRRLKDQLIGIANEFRNKFEQLSATISQLINFTNQVRNDVNTMQAQISGLNTLPNIRNVLLSRTGTTLTIETDAGTITGTLTEVGTDYVAIQEPTGALVLIPITEINSFV